MSSETPAPRRRRIAGERTRAGAPAGDAAPPAPAPRRDRPGRQEVRAADGAGVGPDMEARAPARLGRTGWAVLVVLALLAAATVSAAVWLHVRADRLEALDTARDQAASAAQEAAGPIVSIDRSDIEGSAEAASAFMTDDYATKYQEGIDEAVSGASEDTGRSITATVKAVAVVPCGDDCDPDRVDVLVYLDQVVREAGETRGTRLLNRAVLTMEHTGGDWLVDEVTGL